MDSLTKWRRTLWWNWTFCDFLMRGKPPMPFAEIKEFSFAEAATKDTVGWQMWRKIDGEWIYVNDSKFSGIFDD